MATSPMTTVFQHLRKAVLCREAEGMTDGQLLKHFIEARDERAFKALVLRHGPMVLGVCRRVLGNVHDAEDAFQASFLILVRKARSLAEPELLGNWLYGVAHRTALEARGKTARRRFREKQVKDMPHPAVAVEVDCTELVALLDQELSRLPDKYRVPVVLCDLEGRSRKEVARRLGLPEGTLSSRLATARKMLAKRLARYGLTVSTGALAMALAQNAASACLPTALVSSTVHAAASVAAGKALTTVVVSAKVTNLMEGVLKAMLLTKIKIGTALLLAVLFVAAGTGLLTYRTMAAEPTEPNKQSFFILKQTPDATDEKPKGEVKLGKALSALERKLLGAWKAEGVCVGDLTFRADGTYERVHFSPGDNTCAGTWEVRWDTLPLTLILTCKTSDFADYVGMKDEVKLIQLDDEILAYMHSDSKTPMRFARVKRTPSERDEQPKGEVKLGKELSALERKLLGTWKGGACQGDWTFAADGTFEVRHYTPGNNKLTGTWEVRWNALPPTLVLTCKTSDAPDRLRAGKTWEVKLVQLDDEVLAVQHPEIKTPTRYERVKK